MSAITRHKSGTVAAALALLVLLSGCENSAQKGGLGGAGLGAIVGQIAGRDTKSTLIGAGIGAGVGYVIGNEKDKKEAKEQTEEMRQAQARNASQPSTTAPPQTTSQVRTTTTTTTKRTYQPEDLAPLAGTRWQVISVTPKEARQPYASKLIEFRPDGRVVTTTTDTDGNVDVDQERYRVVGDTLIVNQPGYLVNAKFRISGSELIVSAEKFSAVLKRLG